jgi:hypothetical protein
MRALQNVEIDCRRGLSKGVNECEAGNSPPDTGGVAAPSRKRCEASLINAARYCASRAAQTWWLGLSKCFRMHSLEEVPFSTTPSAPLKEASRLLLDVASIPPMSGGEWRTQFIRTFVDRAYNRFDVLQRPLYQALSGESGRVHSAGLTVPLKRGQPRSGRGSLTRHVEIDFLCRATFPGDGGSDPSCSHPTVGGKKHDFPEAVPEALRGFSFYRAVRSG